MNRTDSKLEVQPRWGTQSKIRLSFRRLVKAYRQIRAGIDQRYKICRSYSHTGQHTQFALKQAQYRYRSICDGPSHLYGN